MLQFLYNEEGVAITNPVPILLEDGGNDPFDVGFDLVHELHGFNDAEALPLGDPVPDLNEGLRLWGGRTVEGADKRGSDSDG